MFNHPDDALPTPGPVYGGLDLNVAATLSSRELRRMANEPAVWGADTSDAARMLLRQRASTEQGDDRPRGRVSDCQITITDGAGYVVRRGMFVL